MHSRIVLVTFASLVLAGPALCQIPAANANSFELDNGTETFLALTPSTTPTVGNVAGTGVVNLTPADQMFWEILPKELMHSSNGTSPGTMELTTFEFHLFHSRFGSGGPGGTPAVRWDMTIHPVTYVNPISGAGPDGRRYPNLAATPIVTIVGGPTGLPPPAGCPFPNAWIYDLSVELGNAAQGSGIQLPADGNTDLAWCFWSPGGMSILPPDPTNCELGGNLSLMNLASTNEHVPSGVSTGAAIPAPTGVNRNPFMGARNGTSFNNISNTTAWEAWPGFREPVLQFRYHYSSGGPTAGGSMPTPQRGSGALFMDASGPSVLLPGFRTCASGHLGELVIHVLSSGPLIPQPGIQVTPTANLLLDPNDSLFFFLTPALDVFVGPNTTDYLFAQKHTADSPLGLGIGGPIPAPGIQFTVQAFVVNVAAGPPFSAVSTNVAHGRVW